jgi:formate-dependent nitrite reductase membrane component NrfD
MIGFIVSLIFAGVAIGVMLMAVVQRHAKQRARAGGIVRMTIASSGPRNSAASAVSRNAATR